MRNHSSFITKSTSKKVLHHFFLSLLCLFFLTSCETSQKIITGVDEREANLIVVFLESRGIKATKSAATTAAVAGGGQQTVPQFDISVDEAQAIEAMAILNKNGLPRQKGVDLLQLFKATGLMTSAKEETIRYQAGLAQQINNMILMIDGVIDSDVQISFPPEAALPGQTVTEKITAAVYVKHQGVIDDPNTHLEDKIKRLVSGSVTGLDINDVTVVSDRSRFTDVSVIEPTEKLSTLPKEYVSIWSIVMNKESAGKFRFLFFTLTFISILLALLLGWMIWKVYPLIKRKGGFKQILSPIPITSTVKEKSETPKPEERK